MKTKFLILIAFGFLAFSAIAKDSIEIPEGSIEEDLLFEKIFEDPGNIQLNIDLAKIQLTKKNLKAASATLERIVQLYPNEIEPKLLLAEVEFNLGNFFEAKNLFQVVIESSKASLEHKRIANDGILKISELSKKWDIFGTAIATYGQSKNPTSTPKYYTILGQNYLNQNFSDEQDQFKEILASIGLKYNIEGQSTSNFFTSFNYYDRHYFHNSPVDLRAYTFNLGYEIEALGGRNVLTNSLTKVDLGSRSYINSKSLNLAHEHFFSNFKSLTNLSLGYNKHQECDDCASSDSRSNLSKGIGETLTFSIKDKFIIESNLSYTNYDAKSHNESYEMTSGMLSSSYISSYGNISIAKNISYNHYQGIDSLAFIKRNITVDTQSISWLFSPFHFEKGWQNLAETFSPASPQKDDWVLRLNAQWGSVASEIKTYQKDIEEISLSIIKQF